MKKIFVVSSVKGKPAVQHFSSAQNNLSAHPLRKRIGLRAILRFVVFLLILPMLLFGLSGQLNWPMAWAYMLIYIGSALASRLILMVKSPDLLSERAQFLQAEGVKSWDTRLVPLIALFGPLAVLVVAALDQRFSWSPPLSPWVEAAGLVIFLLGTLLGVWAITVNRFFSSVVRIQTDRGHQVVNGGPYRYIRHPAYAGNVFSILATALMLGSLWSMIPAIPVVIGLIIRTHLEDRDLCRELEGYEAYARQTRNRLIPGIW